MTDDPKVEESKAEEAELRAELEADGEVFDSEGKPLPWNHPKRVRQIYKEAKAGRQASAALKDLGVKPSDVPRLKADFARLAEFDDAYEKHTQAQAAGDTTADDDEEAAAAKKQAEKIRKQLKALGVKFDEAPNEEAEQARASQTAIQAATARVRETILDSLEDAGIELAEMDASDRADLMEELDMKVGQKIKRTEGLREQILGGSIRPVKKIVTDLLEAMGKVKPSAESPKASGIKNLPPRVSGSTPPGKASPRKVDEKPPKSVKEATEQMVADLAARRRDAAKNV